MDLTDLTERGQSMELTEGNVRSQYLHYLLPSLGGALVVSIYSFVDTMAVGQGVGPDGAAALAVVTPLFQIAAFFGILCGMGGSVLMAAARGARDTIGQKRSFTTALLSLIVLGGLGTLLIWLARDPLYTAFGASESILPLAHGYGDLLILGFPSLMLSTFLGFFLRNDNDPNRILIASLIGGGFNVFGDWLFVFPMHMSIQGAALATVIGSVIQTLVLCTHFLRPDNTLHLSRSGWSVMESIRICQNGFGSAFLEIALIIATFLMNNAIMTYYNAAVLAIYGVLLTIGALAQNVFQGIALAAQPLISENYGAKIPGRILETLRMAAWITALGAALILAVGLCFPVGIMQLFIACTDEITALAPALTRMYFLSIPFLAFGTLFVAFLQSLQKAGQAMLLTLLRGIVLISAFVLLFPLVFGNVGIWYAVICNEAIVCGLGLLFSLRAIRSLRVWKQADSANSSQASIV